MFKKNKNFKIQKIFKRFYLKIKIKKKLNSIKLLIIFLKISLCREYFVGFCVNVFKIKKKLQNNVTLISIFLIYDCEKEKTTV